MEDMFTWLSHLVQYLKKTICVLLGSITESTAWLLAWFEYLAYHTWFEYYWLITWFNYLANHTWFEYWLITLGSTVANHAWFEYLAYHAWFEYCWLGLNTLLTTWLNTCCDDIKEQRNNTCKYDHNL